MEEGQQRDSLGIRVFYWWADRPSVQLFVLVLATTIALIGLQKPSLLTDLFPSRPANQEQQQRDSDPIANLEPDKPVPEVEPFQVGGGDVTIVASSHDFFTRENLTAIRKVVDALEELPQVRRVLWVESIPGINLFGLPESLLPRSDASDRQLELGRERTLANPLAVGQLISGDGKTILLHVSLDWFYATSDAASTSALRETAAAAAATVPDSDLEIMVTGRVPLRLMMHQNHVRDAWRFQLIGYCIMMISAMVLFRGLSSVVIVAVAPALGVFWTMCSLRFFDLQENPFSAPILPILVSLVGLTDSVHMMVEIRAQRAAGRDVREATRRGVARVGMACVLTSLTTAIGFASLYFAHHQIVREFGLSCVLGVFCTLLSVLTVVPLGCRSPLGRRLHVGLGKSVVDGQLKRLGPIVAWVLDNDRKTASIAIVSTAVLIAICTQLTPDQKRYGLLGDSGEAAQGLRYLDCELGGLEFAYVNIHWDRSVEQSQLLQVLEEVNGLLAAEPLIGHPLGVRELLAALPGEGEPAERMTLLELLPAELKRAFYTPEKRTAYVQFRVQDIGIAKYGPVFERLEKSLEALKETYPDFTLRLRGTAIWRWENIYRIVTDMAKSLGTASVIIWLVLTIVYRSIRIGLISIVPNVFPLVATGATLVFAGQYLEIVTVCVFTICIGIAVDDTIHFLTRYKGELRPEVEHRVTIERAFTGVGSALLMTTIVLVVGMLTAVSADARDARLFGMMGALTLTTALFADIIFLPALLSRFANKKES